jgi:hypothetical protein
MNNIKMKTSTQHYSNLGRYFYFEGSQGKHSVCITIADHEVRVIVHNASNRTWRGMGKTYRTLNDAISAYKTPSIVALIIAAGEANAADIVSEALAKVAA